jgi:uncharacterized protein (TIGR03083 family)
MSDKSMTALNYAEWVSAHAEAVREAGARALELARTLSEAELARVTEGEGWSVRDELAHIAASQTDFVGVLGAIVRGEMPDTSVFADIDVRNARNIEDRRGWPTSQIADELERSGGELQRLLARLTPEDETRTPDGFPFPLGQLLTGYAMHDPYHVGQIESVLQK